MNFQNKIKEISKERPSKSADFFINFCKDDLNFRNFLENIFKECHDSQTAYSGLKRMALIIFSQHPLYGNGQFIPTELMKAFQDYIYSWIRLPSKVPLEDITDILEKGIQSLEIMVKNNELTDFKKSKTYAEFREYYSKRYIELKESKKYYELQFYMDGE